MDVAEIVVRLEKEKIEIRDKALVAYDPVTGKIYGFGGECEKFAAIEGISIVSPLEEGKITDYMAAVALFKLLLNQAYKEAGKKPLFKKSVLLCAGGKLNEVDKKAFEDCIYKSSNPRELYINEKSYAKTLEEWEILNVKKMPEVILEIIYEDIETIVKNSVKRVMELAKQQGVSEEEVIKIFNVEMKINN